MSCASSFVFRCSFFTILNIIAVLFSELKQLLSYRIRKTHVRIKFKPNIWDVFLSYDGFMMIRVQYVCGKAIFVGHFLLFVFHEYREFLSVHYSLVVTCWERANLLALLCEVLLCFCHFPVWCPGSGCIDF